MIIDKLENIDSYSQIPAHAVEFVKNMTKNTECKRYEISDTDYVNVETYTTKAHENCCFEAHKNYADIQILLDGVERLDYTEIENLKIKNPYDESRDIAFYENTVKETCNVTLDGTNFVFIFPNEAHRPQMNFEGPVKVKKAVVKVKM